jgi:hypothetical protein
MEMVCDKNSVWVAAGGMLAFPLFASSLLSSTEGSCPASSPAVDLMLGTVVASPILSVLLVVLASAPSKPIDESRQLGILVTKIASALVFSSAVVNIVVQAISRMTMLSIIAIYVSVAGLCYSHGVELWLGLAKEQRAGGLVRFLDKATQKTLLQDSWMDFWTDPNVGDTVSYYVNLTVPFFFDLTREETAQAISRMPEDYRKKMFRRGLVYSMPDWVQTLLLPAKETLQKKKADPSTTLKYEKPESLAPKPPDIFVDTLIAKTVQKAVEKALLPKQIEWKPVGMAMTAVFVFQVCPHLFSQSSG